MAEASSTEPGRLSRRTSTRPFVVRPLVAEDTGSSHADESRSEPEEPEAPSDAPSVGRGPGPLHEAALRALNYVVAFTGLVLTAPLMAVIAVAIKLDSPGPVIYRQRRVGRDRRGQTGRGHTEGSDRRTDDLGGRPFRLYKFRTMRTDAEANSGPTWSSPDDDRTTRVGRFLRRHRLDELPQLWNVLKGEMAVVGPRPERPPIVQRLRNEIESYTKRQKVRPGITGWAQVNRASDQEVGDVEQKLRYDLAYVDHRSLGFDAWVMWRTPLVMARPEMFQRPRGRDTRPRESDGTGSAGEKFAPPELVPSIDRLMDSR